MISKGKDLFVSGLLIFFLSFAMIETNGQTSSRKPSRQAALDAFAKGDYEKAYLEFDVLLSNYSKDPLYKYYKGVCLVKMNKAPDYAQEYLEDALHGALDIKSVPVDAWFYLGRARQMAGNYTDAVESFKTYESKAGKRVAREMNVSTYIDECNEGRGKITNVIQPQPKLAEETISTQINAAVKVPEEDTVNEKVSIVEKPAPRKEATPEGYDRVMSEAMDYQVKADSLSVEASEAKSRLGKLSANEQKAEKSRIAEMETKSADYQKLADNKFNDSNEDLTGQVAAGKPAASGSQENEKAVLSLFSVEKNPLAASQKKISFDDELPSGLIYRIQIGVFSKPLDISFFKGISPITAFKVQGTEATKYFAGIFRRSADAGNALLQVRQAGFRDAFVTAFMDRKAVSIDRASILEKEWGTRSLVTKRPDQKPAEPVVSTLVYRVEIIRTAKPVTTEMSGTYKTMAGNRDFEVINGEDGSFVYLIGKFITFESASEYASLLNRNGYREAKVVAYLGSREIPLETARQLFDSQK